METNAIVIYASTHTFLMKAIFISVFIGFAVYNFLQWKYLQKRAVLLEDAIISIRTDISENGDPQQEIIKTETDDLNTDNSQLSKSKAKEEIKKRSLFKSKSKKTKENDSIPAPPDIENTEKHIPKELTEEDVILEDIFEEE